MRAAKRILSAALALTLTCSFAACAEAPAKDSPGDSTVETTAPVSKELTEAEKAILQERRDIAEAYMRESLSVLWTSDENLIYSLDSKRDNGLKLYIIQGRIYQGVPYSYAVGTHDSFLEYAGEPDKDGVYTISGLEATALNYESYGGRVGNDCSAVVTNAWSQIGASFDSSRSCEMTQAHGVIPLGDYNFNPTINPETGNITNTGVCTTSNGALTYYLYLQGLVKEDTENVFVQGEHMNRPSEIRSRLAANEGDVRIQIGGRAVMSMACDLKI